MSNANSAKGADMHQQQAKQRAEKKSASKEKARWFNYMKKDELAPEETREIAFLGYN